MTRPLSHRFLASLPPGRGEPAGDELEDALRALVDAGRAAWPSLALAEERFLAHCAARVPTEDALVPSLRALNAADLWLAAACCARVTGAAEALDRRYLAAVPGYIARIDRSPDVASEVTQLLRERLLVGDDGGPGKIADYGGRGPLAAWLRVSAVRTALSLKRGERGPNAVNDSAGAVDRLADGAAPSALSPDAAYLKARYRREFQEGLAAAVAALSPQQKNVIRLHFLDGLTGDQIAAMFKVHRVTVMRWIAEARKAILDEVKRRLAERMQLQSTEFESVARLVRSQLNLSLKSHLSEREPE